MNPDLARALDDIARSREELLSVVRPLRASDLRVARRGGWTVERVLEHVIQSEYLYSKLLAHQCGKSAPDLVFETIDDGATAAAQLGETRAAVEAMVDGIQDDTLYLLVQFGHEEYSPLSLLENIALHDREHYEQIATVLRDARAAAHEDQPSGVDVRLARLQDLPRLTEIYNHYVVNTPTTFDLDPFSVEQRREWFSHYRETGPHRLLVAEDGSGIILGYASSSRFHPRKAYDTTVEMTVVSAPEAIGRRIGQRLYGAIFDALAGEDIHSAVALITLPNDASCALHERWGFSRAGLLKEAGRKFGRYWDVAWYQRVFEEAR